MAEKQEKAKFTLKWTPEQTQEFIKLRSEHRAMFTGTKESSQKGFTFIMEKMGLSDVITHQQAKKKWDNLKTKYKDCKCPASGQGTEDGKPTAETWPWFSLMDEALGKTAAISPRNTVVTIVGEEEHSKDGEDEDEAKEGGSGTSNSGTGGRKRKKEEDPFLALWREDMQHQRDMEERREKEAREKEERRAREVKEREDRFFSLLQKLVDK